MATMAINADGTGLSQVYIASEEDLIIKQFTSSLLSDVSFIRVCHGIGLIKKEPVVTS